MTDTGTMGGWEQDPTLLAMHKAVEQREAAQPPPVPISAHRPSEIPARESCGMACMAPCESPLNGRGYMLSRTGTEQRT
jgi:hypothetical protein